MQQHSTLHQITQLAHQLEEGDRIRLLKFAQAMMKQKQGKRQQRRQNTQARLPEVNSWQINSLE